MRQGHQNRRGRGRGSNSNHNNNNNNRKNQNPLTRSFESTGPDIKIRGTPAHVAEKYVSLARDALSSGDRVLAENYLQHAEHYNRIILTFREQQIAQGIDSNVQPGGGARQSSGQQGDPSDLSDDGDQDGDMQLSGGSDDGLGHNNGNGGRGEYRQDNRQNQNRAPRPNGNGNGNGDSRENRDSRGNRDDGGRPRRRERYQPNRDGDVRAATPHASAGPGGDQQPSVSDQAESEQPAFLRRPVRRGKRDVKETTTTDDNE